MPVITDEKGNRQLLISYPPKPDGSVLILPAQEKFFNSFRSPKNPNGFMGVGLVGGVGSGKTITSCVKAMDMLLSYPGCRGSLTNKDTPQLEKTTIYTFFQLFPEELVGKYNEVKKTLTLHPWLGGGILYFQHTHDPELMKGPNLLFFGMDEATESYEKAFTIMLGRLRRDVDKEFPKEAYCYWITSNSNGKDWVYYRFFSGKYADNTGIVAKTSENTFHGPEYEQRLRAQYTAEEAARYLDASFESFSGKIYSEFSRSKNVCDPFIVPDHWNKWRAIDFGVVHPAACIWIAEGDDKNLYVYCEWRQADCDIPDMAAAIKKLSDGERYNLTVADYAGKKVEQTSRTSPFDQLKAEGIPVVEARKHDKLFTIQRINRLFKDRKLFIFSNCEYTIDEIEVYSWARQQVTGELKPTPKKVKDDLMDCLQYGISLRPDLTDPAIDPAAPVPEVKKEHVARTPKPKKKHKNLKW